MYPETWDYATKGYQPDFQLYAKNFNKVTKRYQKSFREAFKAIEDYLEVEGDQIRQQAEEQHQIGPISVIIENKNRGEQTEFAQKILRKWFQSLESVIKKTKKAGFGKVLDHLVVRIQFRDALGRGGESAGEYDHFNDELTMVDLWGLDDPGVLVHEIGHRFYKKHLSKEAQQGWEEYAKSGQIGFISDYAERKAKIGNFEEAYCEAFRKYIWDGPTSFENPKAVHAFRNISRGGGVVTENGEKIMSVALQVIDELKLMEKNHFQQHIDTLQELFKQAEEEEHPSHPAVVRSTLSIMDFKDQRTMLKRLERQLGQNADVKPRWSAFLNSMMRNIRQGAYDFMVDGSAFKDVVGEKSVLSEIIKEFRRIAR